MNGRYSIGMCFRGLVGRQRFSNQISFDALDRT